MAFTRSTLGQLASSSTAHAIIGALAAMFLPKLPFFFVLQFLGVYELVSRLSSEIPALPSIRAYLDTLPSPFRIFKPEECIHCKDSFEDPVVLSCGHVYCRECIYSWIAFGKNYCPLCSRVVYSYRLRDEHRVPTLTKIYVCVSVSNLTASLMFPVLLVTHQSWKGFGFWDLVYCGVMQTLNLLVTMYELAIFWKLWHSHGSGWWRHPSLLTGHAAPILVGVRGFSVLLLIGQLQYELLH
ncbi:uncharacterized protein MYCGRDRAFT_96080 [Zymoseptoria tritici IPO323]|uniref:RING-type domain-containing protein n=1 Tax=Zymoseptoria tritici (strain CBS 115943 / IPO323) TaxID=336722 RepID=F9XL85_ZYMTI|nr:uncharacterized protein MYCGRDRAFT_96080 [Zymoseptoria tritici IPO323]EGP84181.1 hypothetical protein MYCGRDRAFT_96080 [Zymoseptoria tritici IPO323]